MHLNELAYEFISSIKQLSTELSLLREQLAKPQAQQAQPPPQAPAPPQAPPPAEQAPAAPLKLVRPRHLRKAKASPSRSAHRESQERCSDTLEMFPIKERIITQVGYDPENKDFRLRIRQLISQGLGYYQIANKLNAEGYVTERGQRFYHGSVKRLCRAMGLLSEKARRQMARSSE